MISLLIAVGALFLVVIASTIIDPWPQPSRKDADDDAPTVDVTILPI